MGSVGPAGWRGGPQASQTGTTATPTALMRKEGLSLRVCCSGVHNGDSAVPGEDLAHARKLGSCLEILTDLSEL